MKSFLLIFFLALLSALAQTNIPAPAVQTPSSNHRAADIRTACINGRRCVCGKVIKIVPHGLIVESGYTELLKPPFNQSWVISGGAALNRDPTLLERSEPASPCIGTVFLTDIPKRPTVKLYDYILLQAYPAGDYIYIPVPGVQKTIRQFSAGLDTAVKIRLEAGEN